MTRVFVYGSLLSGERNHGWLDGAHFLRTAQTRPEFTLHDLGSFPGLVTGGSTPVWGEIYEVEPKMLAELDHIEGHPRFYRRTPITLADGTEVEVYLLPLRHASPSPVIVTGSWKERVR